jgi:tetratricopeptide (TPR) repeat protein
MSHTQNNKKQSTKDSNKYPKNDIIHFITLILIGILGGFIGSYLFFYSKPSISIPIVTNTQDLYTIHLNLLQFYLAFIAIVLTVLTFILAWKINDIQSKSEKIQEKSQQAVETSNKFAQESKYSLLVSKGISYLNQESFPEAIECFETAIKFNPNDATPHFHLGLVYINPKNKNPNKNSPHPITCFEKAIKLNPSYTAAYYNLGMLHWIIGINNQSPQDKANIAQAEKNFQIAINLNPSLEQKVQNLKQTNPLKNNSTKKNHL